MIKESKDKMQAKKKEAEKKKKAEIMKTRYGIDKGAKHYGK